MNKKIFSKNCNLSSYTTIKVGGVAEYFAEPRSIDEFYYLMQWSYLNNQRIIRNLDQLHIINSSKELIMTAQGTEYIPIDDRAIKMVLNDDRPFKIINAFENYSGALIKRNK